MIVLGIDPGQTGGIALVEDLATGPFVISGVPMFTQIHRKKIAFDWRAAKEWRVPWGGLVDFGILEQVSAMPRQGVSSSFQFGRMYGAAEVFLQYAAPRYDYITPTVWKKALGLSSSKGASLDLATRIFGQDARDSYWPLKKHDGVAEAALIAYWWIQNNKKGK